MSQHHRPGNMSARPGDRQLIKVDLHERNITIEQASSSKVEWEELQRLIACPAQEKPQTKTTYLSSDPAVHNTIQKMAEDLPHGTTSQSSNEHSAASSLDNTGKTTDLSSDPAVHNTIQKMAEDLPHGTTSQSSNEHSAASLDNTGLGSKKLEEEAFNDREYTKQNSGHQEIQQGTDSTQMVSDIAEEGSKHCVTNPRQQDSTDR